MVLLDSWHPEGTLMENGQRRGPVFDGGVFCTNRNRFPPDELEKYAGLRVAWSLDGTQILASGVDDSEVDRNLRAAGLDPEYVVHSYVYRPDEVEHG
jgi:hypothetical protein